MSAIEVNQSKQQQQQQQQQQQLHQQQQQSGNPFNESINLWGFLDIPIVEHQELANQNQSSIAEQTIHDANTVADINDDVENENKNLFCKVMMDALRKFLNSMKKREMNIKKKNSLLNVKKSVLKKSNNNTSNKNKTIRQKK